MRTPTHTVHDLWLAFASTWSSHDQDQLLSLYTDDVHYEDVTFGVVKHGKDELRAFGELVVSGFPDVSFEMTSGRVADYWDLATLLHQIGLPPRRTR